MRLLTRNYEITCLAAEIPESLPGRQTGALSLGSIEGDTGLNLFGTRDSLMSAMASGTVEDHCF